MHNSLSTLIMPTTLPDEIQIGQLLLLFDTISLYAPAEDSINANFSFCRHQLCRHYAPVPFGKGLPEFQQLLREIKGHRAEYYGGGISSLSNFSGKDLDESAVWQLIGKLRPQSPDSSEHSEVLTQARLLLKLAELFYLEEEDIKQNLAEINTLTDTFMAALQDEEHSITARPAPSTTPTVSSNTKILPRLQAWSQLFFADQSAKPWIVTTTTDSFEILYDYAGKKISDAPAKLFALDMPRSWGELPACSNYLALRARLREETTVCRTFLKNYLTQAATDDTILPPKQLTEQLSIWQDKISSVWGADSPTLSLVFYRFPMSLDQLLAQIGKEKMSGRSATAPNNHAIVAVLTEIAMPSSIIS